MTIERHVATADLQPAKRKELQDWPRFIRAKSQIMRQQPSPFFQQTTNQPDSSVIGVTARAGLMCENEKRATVEGSARECRRAQSAGPLSPRRETGQGCSQAESEEPSGARHAVGPIDLCEVSPDSSLVVSAANFKADLRTWNTATHEAVGSFPGERFAAFLPDGRILTRSVRSWGGHGDASGAEAPTHATAWAVSPRGARALMVEGASDGWGREPVNVSLWDTRTRTRITLLDESGGNEPSACAFSRDGRRVLTTSSGDMLCLWDAATGVELWRAGPQEQVVEIRFSIDNQRILSRARTYLAGGRRPLLIWDAATGMQVGDILGNACGIHYFDLSTDGRMVVTAAYIEENAITRDPTIKLWRLESGSPVSVLAGHQKTLTDSFSFGKDDYRFIGCRYSADSRFLVSASDDRTIRVWGTETGAELTCFHTDVSLSALGLGGGAGLVVAGNEIGELFFLRLEAAQLVIPFVTAVRLYNFDRSDWNPEPTVVCLRCGARFTPPPDAIDAVHGITKDAGLSPDESPCATLPDEAWDEPRLGCRNEDANPQN